MPFSVRYRRMATDLRCKRLGLPVSRNTAHFLPALARQKDLKNPLDRLRAQAKSLRLSKDARLRLEWFLWHEEKGGGDVSLTCRHFGIARKTFYKWKPAYDKGRLPLLETKSSTPKHVRQPEHTRVQYARFCALRRRYPRWGKEKLLRIYRMEHPEDTAISLWHVQRMTVRAGMYYSPKKNEQRQRRRAKTLLKPRPRIHTLSKEAKSGFLLCLDTVERRNRGQTRFIYTAVDKYSRVAFAHAYTTHSSTSAKDFLCRLYYVLDGRITNIQTDNGQEFRKYFEQTAQKLKLTQYYSRVRTPKDNGTNERFNRTLSEEFLQLGNMTENTPLLNERLTRWLIEYNFKRPHQALNYEPPMNYHYRKQKVLPTCPSSTCP